jgi:hypothetical protein
MIRHQCISANIDGENVILSGGLDVQYVGGFSGSVDDAFDLIAYASANGSFASVIAPLGVTFSSADFGTFYRFTINQPPEPDNPFVPEFGINPIIGTLLNTVDEPIYNPLFFKPFIEPESVLPEDRPISKCN